METTNATSEQVLTACAIARGELVLDGSTPAITITAALQDISARGRVRQMWYRMAWKGGTWSYLGNRRLSQDHLRADGRHDKVEAHVAPGTLICQHDRGKQVDIIALVTADPVHSVVDCQFHLRSDGQFGITLPDGSLLVRPNPRKAI